MGSALPVGSLAVVVPQEEYFVGDVVTFKIPGSEELLTHRVVSVSDSAAPPDEFGGFGSFVAAPPWGAFFYGRAGGSQLQVNATRKYKTRGDANNVADDWELTDADIVGKVVFHLPYLGYILRLPQILLTAVLQKQSYKSLAFDKVVVTFFVKDVTFNIVVVAVFSVPLLF